MVMNSVAEFLSADDMLLNLDAPNKVKVFEEVGRLFERRHGLAAQQVVDSLCAREKMASTGLGQGVALPHARIKKLPKAMAAYVRLKNPIPFDSPDGKPVSDMLVLLVPEQATELHLQILAEFAQMLADHQLRTRIRACQDAAAVCRQFSEWSALE
jgi:PTS system nitrogen regulatory IIA component